MNFSAGGGISIKFPIRFGTVTIAAASLTGTTAVSPAVNPDKTLRFHNGQSSTSAGVDSSMGRIYLNGAGDTLTAERGGNSGTLVINYCLVEFN